MSDGDFVAVLYQLYIIASDVEQKVGFWLREACEGTRPIPVGNELAAMQDVLATALRQKAKLAEDIIRALAQSAVH